MSFPVYQSPILFQRGHGLGNVLARVFRTVVPLFKSPMIKKGLKHLGKTAALATLHSAEQSLNSGSSFKKNLKENLKQSGQQEIKKLIDEARKSMVGSGRSRIKRINTSNRSRSPRKRGVNKRNKAPKRSRRLSVRKRRSYKKGVARDLDIFDYI